MSIMIRAEREHIWELASAAKDGHIVEVGSHYGGTTILLALAANRQVIAIDNGQAGRVEEFKANIATAYVDVDFRLQDSVEAAKAFPDESCAIVIVDADHEGAHPYQDICAWAPKVQPGGHLLIDDSACNHPQVSQAIFQFLCESHDWNYVHAFEHDEWRGQVKLLSLQKYPLRRIRGEVWHG